MIKQIFLALNILAIIGSVSCNNLADKSSQKILTQNLSENCKILGNWEGLLDAGSCKLTMIFDISQDPNGNLTAKGGCLEQGICDFPVDVILKNGSLKLGIKEAGVTYEGLLDEKRTEIKGTFTQSGYSFPLILKRGKKILHSQEPKPPFPYIEENIKYENPIAKATLSGTLTIPRSNKPCPAVILIAGSGPNDRNETIFGHKPFLVLADHLTKKGIAVLRFDKRGIGESTGDYKKCNSEDFAADVLAGIKYLKTRREIDTSKIGLIGHSEGGLIAPMVASKSKDVAYIVMMAGPGVTGEEILYEQGTLMLKAMGSTKEEIAQERALQKEMFSIVMNEKDTNTAAKQLKEVFEKSMKELPQEKKPDANALESEIDGVNSRWFRYFLTCDPTVFLKNVKVPVLALNGSLDLQVSSKQNLPVIAKALNEAGNKDYQTIEFPKLNHLFQTCETGSLTEYAKIEETITPMVLNTISDWVLKKTTENNGAK